ncbi:long-chain fatty acid--CoA ligase [Anaerotruncus sp. AF02-27]|uniref:class I adenylate-forming enzyme family protein n=1 Tax=Anaerotruncus TaxID=244127 RepID=UPI000E46D577|nr:MULTISPECIES: class I adenylate-forming enzyme family protein [Anaerotruncus]RGX56107.1 long-chain fatty acid--CoA ligase [Anaerotruncus sp. AF02-27]
MASWGKNWPEEMEKDLAAREIGGRQVVTFPGLPPSIYHALSASAARNPDKTALVDNWGRPYSYAMLLRLTNQFAGLLHHNFGVRKGDHIGLMLYNSVEFCISFLALCKIGAVTVPLPSKYKQPEVLSLAEKADVCGVICDADFYNWFLPCLEQGVWLIKSTEGARGYGFASLFPEEAASVKAAGEPADPVILMFTSGTTSRSKGALLRNYNLMHAVEAYRRTLRISEEDRTMISVPIYHITGMSALLSLFLYVGGTIYLQKKVDGPRMLACIRENEITFLHVSPTVLYLLLDCQERFPHIPSLRKIACGSSNTPPEIIRRYHSWMPLMEFHTVYGLTETTSPATVFPYDAALSPHIGSDGWPIPGLECIIVDENGQELQQGAVGEVALRGAVILESYYHMESGAFLPGGWFRTGDLGYFDPQGYLFIVDRKKDMINRGGEKICSFDVENELYALPGVAEAAVVGVPDEKYGEIPAAAVRLQKGAELTEAEIRAALAKRLAKYQIPQRFLFLSEIPKTPNTKTDKKAIRLLFTELPKQLTEDYIC